MCNGLNAMSLRKVERVERRNAHISHTRRTRWRTRGKEKGTIQWTAFHACQACRSWVLRGDGLRLTAAGTIAVVSRVSFKARRFWRNAPTAWPWRRHVDRARAHRGAMAALRREPRLPSADMSDLRQGILHRSAGGAVLPRGVSPASVSPEMSRGSAVPMRPEDVAVSEAATMGRRAWLGRWQPGDDVAVGLNLAGVGVDAARSLVGGQLGTQRAAGVQPAPRLGEAPHVRRLLDVHGRLLVFGVRCVRGHEGGRWRGSEGNKCLSRSGLHSSVRANCLDVGAGAALMAAAA